MNTHNPSDFYNTIKQRERAEIKVRGSIFIATAIPVSSKDMALKELDALRSEYYDASHNCFAYRFGKNGLEFRTSDDGEPSGSAGKPMLFILQKYDVSDILLVITRYFGGTKLGIGGLARAYSGASSLVLESCIKVPIFSSADIKVFCTYDDVSAIKKVIDEYALYHDSHYHDAIEFIAKIPLSKIEEFCDAIVSVSAGRAGTVIQKNDN